MKQHSMLQIYPEKEAASTEVPTVLSPRFSRHPTAPRVTSD